MITTFPNAKPYTYRPCDPPPSANTGEGFEQATSREKGDHLHGAAQRANDFFVRADNDCCYDTDPRPGFVRLTNVVAPSLLENGTQFVSGFRSPDGDLAVWASNGYSADPSSLVVSNNGSQVTMQRPMYENNMYAPTQEQLSYNGDGTRTISWLYTPYRNDVETK
jgi:hypothetical protein